MHGRREVCRRPWARTSKGACMRLFRRKPTMDIDLRCPRCTERVPEGATECGMCGLDLRPLHSVAANARTDEVRDRS
jgi:hypothetical protein